MSSLLACCENFTVAHALRCAKGGCTHIKYSELRHSLENLVTDICDDFELEIHLQSTHEEIFAPKSPTTNDAILEIILSI